MQVSELQHEKSLPTDYESGSETVAWGNGVGMESTVLSKHRLDSTNAVINLRYTPANAEIICREYGRDFTKQCIAESLADPGYDLSNKIRANCKAGIFTSISSSASTLYIFMGKNNNYENETGSGAEYVISSSIGPRYYRPESDDFFILYYGAAYGYDQTVDAFRALCPNTLENAKPIAWPDGR